jgi:hypothetical protein
VLAECISSAPRYAPDDFPCLSLGLAFFLSSPFRTALHPCPRYATRYGLLSANHTPFAIFRWTASPSSRTRQPLSPLSLLDPIRSDPILLLCCPPRFSGILSPSSQPASLSFQRSVLLTRLSERSIASPLLYESPKPWTFSELLRFSYLLFVAECLLFSLNPRQISLCSGLIADFLDVLFSTWKSISSGWTNLERIPYRRCCVRVPLKEEADAKIMPWEMEKPSRGFRPAGESGGGGVLLGWTAGRSVLVLPACFRAYRR